MGRMKELFMQQREANRDNDNFLDEAYQCNEYLKQQQKNQTKKTKQDEQIKQHGANESGN